jgi:adenylate cyclase
VRPGDEPGRPSGKATGDPLRDAEIGEDARMEESSKRTSRLREAARRLDSRPGLVASAEFVRRILPGDREYGDTLSTSGDALPQHLGRLVSEVRFERPSAVRELGLGALQAWQSLSESQRRGRGAVDVAILFTDLVGFSTWALEAGDDAALLLLRLIGEAEDQAVSQNQGAVVKRLGDGAMAVFSNSQQAITAALELQGRIGRIDVAGHTPALRAGVHLGRPRKIGADYLGVDVNVAARVAEAAQAGEVLVSDRACDGLQPSTFEFGRARRLKAPGAPKDLSVCTVKALT